MARSRILIVEDEALVRLDLTHRLSDLGYEACSAASGLEALALVQQFRPDLVLMDITLAGDMDGIEAAMQIPDELQVAVIYLTAYAEESTRERARATKPYGYVLKPISVRDLHGTIQIALGRRAADQVVRESAGQLQLALDAAEMTSWEWRPVTRTLIFGARAAEIFGNVANGEADFLGRVHPVDRALVRDLLDRLDTDNSLCEATFRYRPDAAEDRWLRVQGKAFAAGPEKPRRIVGVVQDVTLRRRNEQQLRQAATVFEASQNGILILDPELNVIAANNGYTAISGYAEAEIVGQTPYVLRPAAHAGRFDEVLKALRDTAEWRGECTGRRKSGQLFPLTMNVAAVIDPAGAVAHYVAVLSDISALRRAEEKLAHLAHHDPMTGLPNRILAMDRLDQALERGLRRREQVAIAFVDLDHFKQINDALGHAAGDEVLRTMARRMQACVRAEDTVARLGGDEFMVIMDRVASPADASLVAAKILASLAQPMPIGDDELQASCTIGISLFPHDGAGREELIRAADMAMYVAKQQGRGSCRFYDTEMSVDARQYASDTRDLRRGLEQGELRLFYQPQIEMRTGAVIGMEALVRWQHCTRGLLGAEHVIPLAERSGFIVEVGDWVLRQACEQLRLWRAAELPPLRLAVNVSARQIHLGHLLETVDRVLDDTGTAPHSLEIEITESTLQNEDSCIATLNHLSRLGVTLAIDDFGTGYSCLSSLKTLPIHQVKIDRAFVKNIVEDANDFAITEAIIAMAHRLKMRVIAEGVETPAQEKLLRDQGCDEAQGYLYAKPMPAEDVPEFLRRYGEDQRAAALSRRAPPLPERPAARRLAAAPPA